ncbi:hypothetical protein [Absidia glauca]|uniref:WWE domain-containing protein n=1 Tax=Absidia glauca TaxID=4829 RepID=A0A163JID8_ABSGL|nr:hypothetical protein [Absidia glauca]
MKFSFFKSKSSTTSNSNKKGDQKHKRNTMATAYSNSAYPSEFQSSPPPPPLPSHHPHPTRISHSPSHSISSASTQSSVHTLYPQETRGIFRTLEPVWSYLPAQHDQWIPLAPQNQRVLEHAFSSHQITCTIPLIHPRTHNHPHTPPTMTTVHLSSSQTTSSKKRRPVTQFFTPAAGTDTNHPQQMRSTPNLAVRDQQHLHKTPGTGDVPALPTREELHLHHNLRRALVPYWWFEQDNEQGGKGMCRFDYKNQVRLEALSDGRSTLTLTDASFPVPFQVILEQTDRSLREECCGFMYLNTHLIVQQQQQQLQQQELFLPKADLLVSQPLEDDALYHDAFLNRRCSI